MKEKEIIEILKELEGTALKDCSYTPEIYPEYIRVKVAKENKFREFCIDCNDINTMDDLIENLNIEFNNRKWFDMATYADKILELSEQIPVFRQAFETVNDMQLLTDARGKYASYLSDVYMYVSPFNVLYEKASALRYDYAAAKARVLKNYITGYFEFTEQTHLDITVTTTTGTNTVYCFNVKNEEYELEETVIINETDSLESIKNKIHEKIFD